MPQVYVEIAFVGMHETPPADYGEHLHIGSAEIYVTKYDPEFGSDSLSDLDYSEFRIVGVYDHPPANPNEQLVFEIEDGDTGQHPRWVSIFLADSVVIPSDLDHTGLGGDFHYTGAGFGVGMQIVNPDFSSSGFWADIQEAASESIYGLIGHLGDKYGVGNLDTIVKNVIAVKDALTYIVDHGTDLIEYGMGHGLDLGDPATVDAQLAALLDGSRDAVFDAIDTVTFFPNNDALDAAVHDAISIVRFLAYNEAPSFGDSGGFFYGVGIGDDVPTQFQGTDDSDVMIDGALASQIYCGAGNDIAYGGSGNDQIHDGGGNDYIQGGRGNDVIYLAEGSPFGIYMTPSGVDFARGGAGVDTVSFQNAFITLGSASNPNFGISANLTTGNISAFQNGAETTTVLGGAGHLLEIENLTGTGAADLLVGDGRANKLNGGAGNDILRGAAGSDTLIGGAGIDVASYGGATSVLKVNLTAGTWSGGDSAGDSYQSIEGAEGGGANDVLTGDAGANIFIGGGGSDRLDGGAGSDTLQGGAGADTILGGADADAIDGGAGVDILTYAAMTAGVGLDQFAGSGNYGAAAGDVVTGIETIVGTAFDDSFKMFNTVRNLDAGGGNDIVRLTSDLADVLLGGGGDDFLDAGGGGDTINGGDGFDIVFFAGANEGMTISLANPFANTGVAAGDTYVSIEGLIGAGFSDLLIGDASANKLFGQEGDDELRGAQGADELQAGLGNDTLIGGAGDDLLVDGEGASGNDRYDGGTGVDTVNYGDAGALSVDLRIAGVQDTLGAGHDTLTSVENVIGSIYADHITGSDSDNYLGAQEGNDELIGLEGADYLNGGAGDDHLVGGDGDDVLDGSAGVDQLDGGDGNDTYFVHDSGASITDSSGVDTVKSDISYTLASGLEHLMLGGVGAVNATGNDAANILTGNASANVLSGLNGADTLNGGAGKDTLTGGAARDTFVFNAAPIAANSDTITDFTHNADKIHLENTGVFTALGAATGALAAAKFWVGANAHDSDDRIVYNASTGALYYDSDGNGAHAKVLIATLTTHPTLTASDTQVI